MLVRQTLRAWSARPSHCVLRCSRGYATRSRQRSKPLPTYFQEPQRAHTPDRKVPFGWIISTAVVSGSLVWLTFKLKAAAAQHEVNEQIQQVVHGLQQATQPSPTRPTPAELMDFKLIANNAFSPHETLMSHTCAVGSNSMCEDQCSFIGFSGRGDAECLVWSTFDGHAGPATARALLYKFPGFLQPRLDCLARPYQPNDKVIIRAIKKAFVDFDQMGLDAAKDIMQSKTAVPGEVVEAVAYAASGSCALISLYDTKTRVLRIANTGDSRAILGRWVEESKSYITQSMSTDQTGFNKDEVARLQREHPGEKVIDPATGRVHGLAVTRAFGDARWKWPSALTNQAYTQFWGPAPRPNNVIKTPPYLTAEPEVTEHRFAPFAPDPQNPDFLIMASDGFGTM